MQTISWSELKRQFPTASGTLLNVERGVEPAADQAFPCVGFDDMMEALGSAIAIRTHGFIVLLVELENEETFTACLKDMKFLQDELLDVSDDGMTVFPILDAFGAIADIKPNGVPTRQRLYHRINQVLWP